MRVNDSAQLQCDLPMAGTGIDDPALPDSGMGWEIVREAPVPVQDMNHLDALAEKVVGKKQAMASLRCGLGTHETGVTNPGEAEQLLDFPHGDAKIR